MASGGGEGVAVSPEGPEGSNGADAHVEGALGAFADFQTDLEQPGGEGMDGDGVERILYILLICAIITIVNSYASNGAPP